MERTGTLYDFVDQEFDSTSAPSFKKYISHLKQEREEPVRALTVISERHPIDVFRDFPVEDFSVEIETGGTISGGILARKRESSSYENDVKVWKGQFLVISHSDSVYTVFTVSDKDFFDKGLSRYIQQLPSEIASTYLSSDELRRLIQSLDQRINGNLDVKKAVLKTTRKDTEIDHHQNEKEYFQVFNEAAANDKYVDKLLLNLQNADRPFEFFISRGCATRFIRGDPELYFEILLPSLANHISDKEDVFENRGREYGSRDTSPIEIQYEEGAIQGMDENKRLVRALQGLKRSAVTVFHDNPYVHASVLDFDDGTNVEVYMTSDHSISLIPGFHASRKSISRICDQINKGFLEGEVVTEEDEEPRDFEDYISPA